MRIQVKLFATLGGYIPGGKSGIPLEVEIAEGSSVADLIKKLNLPREELKVVFVNGRTRPLDWLLHTGDEVGMFPPIGGG